MLKSILRITLRKILKDKSHFAFCITSLAIGFTFSILIYLHGYNELTFDEMHDNHIYRIVEDTYDENHNLKNKGIFHPIPLAEELKRSIPAVKTYSRFYSPVFNNTSYVTVEGEIYKEEILFGDFNAFEMFNLPIKEGSFTNPKPTDIVITEKLATKFYGKNSPINKVIQIQFENEYKDFTITAVAENPPTNSSISFNLLLSFDYLKNDNFVKKYLTNWGFGAIITYVKTEKEFNSLSVQSALDTIYKTHFHNNIQRAKSMGITQLSDYKRYLLQPLAEVHFYNEIERGLVKSVNKNEVYFLLMIGAMILIIGYINFANLFIASSTLRSKEVGIRRTSGAGLSQVNYQFIFESILIGTFALLSSLLIVDLILPEIESLFGIEVELLTIFSPNISLLGIIIFLAAQSIIGLYSSYLLTKPGLVVSLSNKNIFGSSNILTKILLSLQFTISVGLVLGILIINKQMNFIQNKDLGFNKSGVLVIENSEVNNKSFYSYLKENASNYNIIDGIAAANQTMGVFGLNGQGFTYKGESKRTGIIRATPSYLSTLGMTLNGQLDFNSGGINFSNQVIVNEACFKDFELSINEPFEELINERYGLNNPNVIGVVENFHYSSLREVVRPALISIVDDPTLSYIFIKHDTQNTNQVKEVIGSFWKEFSDGLPYEPSLLNDDLEAQYKEDNTRNTLVSIALFVAVFLTCLGLLGILARSLRTRRKEIGIRKILGAEIKDILFIFSKSYLSLFAISIFIGMPISNIILENWLSNFAFRVSISSTDYLITILGIVIILAGTINIRTWIDAGANPIENINRE